MTDDEAEKVIGRLKYTKKELIEQQHDFLSDELVRAMLAAISEEIDKEVLTQLKNNHYGKQS